MPEARSSLLFGDLFPWIAEPLAFLAYYLERQFIASWEFWTLQESFVKVVFQNLNCISWKQNELFNCNGVSISILFP